MYFPCPTQGTLDSERGAFVHLYLLVFIRFCVYFKPFYLYLEFESSFISSVSLQTVVPDTKPDLFNKLILYIYKKQSFICILANSNHSSGDLFLAFREWINIMSARGSKPVKSQRQKPAWDVSSYFVFKMES